MNNNENNSMNDNVITDGVPTVDNATPTATPTPAPVQKADTIDANKNAELALKAHQRSTDIAEKARESSFASILGKTKEVTINEGTDFEYKLTLRFPGTAKASQIEDDNMNPFGNINVTAFMKSAIKSIVVDPKIKSLDYFDEHGGYDEAFAKIYSFHRNGLNGFVDED